ncbi:MAG TPA: response regulator [Pyrinomonadaceae bacterium]|nr:response regulator [Pyrinomonadaceae bacterium]
MRNQRSILYVDDYQDACDLMVTFLNGYSVSTACSATDALALISSRLFDLYLLDFHLPDITGIDLCRQIRALDPNTPIIFYSAAARDGHCHDALAAGAQAYLVKPTDLSQLRHAIVELIGKSESHSLDAKQAEIAAMLDGLSERLQRATAHVRRADELELKRRARLAFFSAGGTRSEFERLWPDVLRNEFPEWASDDKRRLQ